MITKVVIALILFSNGTMIEHTVTNGISDCLEKKRTMQRNMSDSVQIMCQKVMADIEIMHDKEFIVSLRKM